MRLRVPLVPLSAYALLLSFACADHRVSLVETRAGFKTKLLRKISVGELPESPTAGVLELIAYPVPETFKI